MPIYSGSLVIPPNTPENLPAEIVIRPTVGRLLRLSVLFPDGCVGLVGCRFLDNGVQIAPVPDGWITGRNAELVSMVENRKLEGEPFRLVVQGYNLAWDWAHTLQITAELVRHI